MKKLVLLLFICPLWSYCQSFGDDFMDWVKKEANHQSRAYTTAHWTLFWENTHVLLHQEISTELQKIDSLMAGYSRFNDSVVRRFDTSNLEQFVTLKRAYETQLATLYTLTGEIEALSGRLDKRPYGFDDFVAAGYHHFGTTTLLESYSKLRNNSDRIATSYGVSYTQGLDANGNAAGQGEVGSAGTAMEPRNDVESAVVGTGLALMQTPKMELYGMIILSVYSGYKLFEASKFEKQEKTLKEAFDLLPKKLLTPKETHAIYDSTFRLVSARYDSLRTVRQEAFRSLDTLSRSLLAFNFEMVSVCNKILSAEKVALLSHSYSQNPKPYEHLFAQQLIFKGVEDVYRFSREVRQLKLSEKEETNPYKKLARREEVEDAVAEYSAITRFLLSRAEFAPVYPEFWDVLKGFQQLQASGLLYSDNLTRRLEQTYKKLVAFDGSKIRKTALPKIAGTMAMTVDNSLVSEPANEPGPYLYYHLQGDYGSGRYTLSPGRAGNAYSHHFPRGGSQGGIDQSPYDGGYRYDRRDPSVETDRMIRNIERRISEMQYAVAGIEGLRVQWTQTNLEATRLDMTRALDYRRTLESTRSRNLAMNGAQVQAFEERVRAFAQQPVSARRLHQFYTENGVTSTVLSQVPRRSIRPNGYSSSYFDPRSAVYKNAGPVDRAVIYETNKTTFAFEAVWQRFKRHQEAGTNDPVFRTEQDLRTILSLSQSYLLAASQIGQATNAFYRNDPGKAKASALAFVENARILRYYSLGMVPKYVLQDQHFFMDYGKLRGVMKDNAHAYYSSCDPNLSLEQSDCNRFTSYYLKDIYGVGDFYNNSEGVDHVLRDGQRVPVLNSSQMSTEAHKNWMKLGDAADQLTLNLAGLYAGMGFAVIAVKPGHVCLILPGDPQKYTYSGTWNLHVPNILNFAQVGHLANLNIKLDEPLSKAWRSPDGVMIFVKPQLKDY